MSELDHKEPGPSLDETLAEPTDLEGICDLIARADVDHDGKITVHEIMSLIGERSFGPMILVPGFIGLSPIGAIPFVPLVTSILVLAITGQILLGHRHIWLPGFLLHRSLPAPRVLQGVDKFRPIARFVDYFLIPRLSFLTMGPFFYILSLFCFLVALITPILEVIPLGGIPPNAAIVAFALAITARDGLWALFAFGFTGASVYFIHEMLF